MTSPETLELEAVDDALAGRYVAPEHADLAELALLLRDDRPEPTLEWATHMDRRVEAGFPNRPRRRRRGCGWATWWKPMAVVTTLLLPVVIAAALAGSDGFDDGRRRQRRRQQQRPQRRRRPADTQAPRRVRRHRRRRLGGSTAGDEALKDGGTGSGVRAGTRAQPTRANRAGPSAPPR